MVCHCLPLYRMLLYLEWPFCLDIPGKLLHFQSHVSNHSLMKISFIALLVNLTLSEQTLKRYMLLNLHCIIFKTCLWKDTLG